MSIRIGIGLKITPVGDSFNATTYFANRTPSDLIAVANSISQVTCYWNDALLPADGLRVYISTDEVNYTLKETVDQGVETAVLTGLSEGTLYYIKLVAFKDTHESKPVKATALTMLGELTAANTLLHVDILSDLDRDEVGNTQKWSDRSPAGNDLTAVDDGRLPPMKTSKGFYFNGTGHSSAVRNKLIATFTSNQPTRVYILFRQKTWVNSATIFDGVTGRNMLNQGTTTPGIRMYGGTAYTDQSNDLPINEWGVVRAFFSGASSHMIVNALPPITKNAGSNNSGGITVGTNYTGGYSGNIEVAAIVKTNGGESEGTQTAIYNYLNHIKNSYFSPVVKQVQFPIVKKEDNKHNVFPSMVELPNGNWFLIYFNNTTHSPATAARTKYMISTDKGKTWSAENDIYPPGVGVLRADSYVSRIDNRVFILLNNNASSKYAIELHYSDDNCSTWSEAITITSTRFSRHVLSHGSLVKTPAGHILMPCWGDAAADNYRSVLIMRSTDGGLTWSDLAHVDNPLNDTINNDGGGAYGWTSESALIYAPDGDLLLYTRGNGLLYRSTDHGATWDSGTSLGMDFGSPQFVRDGNDLYLIGRRRFLLASYAANSITDYTCVYIQSTNSGQTWSAPVIIYKYGGWMEGDGGYCTAIVHDGKISIVGHTNDGYDSAAGTGYLNRYPYLVFIDDIKLKDFGDTEKTLVEITPDTNAGTVTNLKVYRKDVLDDRYEMIGNTNDPFFRIMEDPFNTFDYVYKATVGGVETVISKPTRAYLFDPRAVKYFYNMRNLGVNGEEKAYRRKILLNNLIEALKMANLFDTQFDGIYLIRSKDALSSCLNIVRDAHYLYYTANGGVYTFTDDVGINGDGSKSYVKSTAQDDHLQLYRQDDACFGFKISGTIAANGTMYHGFQKSGHALGFGQVDGQGYVALNSDQFYEAEKRVAGYNNISRKSDDTIEHSQNDDFYEEISDTSAPLAGLLPFYLALNDDGTPANFVGDGEVLEIAWIGKYLSRANFITFQAIIDTYISQLALL